MAITLKTLSYISCFGWFTLLVVQGVFLYSALFTGNDVGLVLHMSEYLLWSTLQVAFFGGVGLALSAALLMRIRRPLYTPRLLLWALAVLSMLALWTFCLSSLAVYWRPPLGDGTFAGALSSYARLHYVGSIGAVASRLWQQLFLLGSCMVWLALAMRRVHRPHRPVY